jgi:hypothetical protein
MGRSDKAYNEPILLGDKSNCDTRFYTLVSPFKKPLNFINELEFLCTQWQGLILSIFLSDSSVYTLLKENETVQHLFEEITRKYPAVPILFNEKIADYCFILNNGSLDYLKTNLEKKSSELLIADNIFLTNRENLVFYESINFYDGIWIEGINLSYKLDIEILKEHYCNYVNKIELIKEIKNYPFVESISKYSCNYNAPKNLDSQIKPDLSV